MPRGRKVTREIQKPDKSIEDGGDPREWLKYWVQLSLDQEFRRRFKIDYLEAANMFGFGETVIRELIYDYGRLRLPDLPKLHVFASHPYPPEMIREVRLAGKDHGRVVNWVFMVTGKEYTDYEVQLRDKVTSLEKDLKQLREDNELLRDQVVDLHRKVMEESRAD